MINNFIQWAVGNRLVVILLALGLMGFGLYSFQRVNIEAYPDPAPAIVEVVAQFPGASAEEVERLVTIPLEVALAGMPGLKYCRTQSLFELCHIRSQFEYGMDQKAARQEVINRLQGVQLPGGVMPEISPQSASGEILRYILKNPTDAQGRGIYTLNDLKSLQDWTLERQFRRLPRVADTVSFGGTVKRYEIHPDPRRLQRYGVSLAELKNAIASNNTNVGGQYVIQGETVQVVRSLGLIGQGEDPMDRAMALANPVAAQQLLRAAEQDRIRQLRQIVIKSVNNVPVRVDDIVDGGPLPPGKPPDAKGVFVGHQTRLGRVLCSRPVRGPDGQMLRDGQGRPRWENYDDVVEGVVLMRKGEQTLPALEEVNALVRQVNGEPGRLLPGVQLLVSYDRSALIHVTTHTVRENLLAGMALVGIVLLMFLDNIPSAIIVAINVPLALLFAFAVLFLRGKSANLLSIGAVDFGIIVDSSVIMVENIYRHLAAGDLPETEMQNRILHATRELQRSLFFSTAIMVCTFLPLFTMAGPAGQIFGPMADTYAFALGGALLLALALSPVLCRMLLGRVRHKPPNLLVRGLQSLYRWQLAWCLRFRWLALLAFLALVGFTVALLPLLGREFMPELEEGNIWVRGTFPLYQNLDETIRGATATREVMQHYPEIEQIIAQVGRPDDGTDPEGFYYSEYFLPLRPQSDWPIPPGRNRARTKSELIDELNRELQATVPAVQWNFSQAIRDMVMEAMSGVGAENSVKLIGPDIQNLENKASQVVARLQKIPGIEDVGAYHILGQSNLVLPIDRRRCAQWGIPVGDVEDTINTALAGQPLSQMIEGERSFDITARWPESWRNTQDNILAIPVEITRNAVTAGGPPGLAPTPVSGGAMGPSPTGNRIDLPALTGSAQNAPLNAVVPLPERPLARLLQPPGQDGSYVRKGASTIYREQGQRLIAIKFDVHDRDLAGAIREAQQATDDLADASTRMEWSGEFQEMEQAEQRLLVVIPLVIALVLVLLYIAFRSLVDVLLVLSNVVTLCCGGIWALLLTRTNFSISAAVGFISIFGVAVMNGLLLVSQFHRMRLEGMAMDEAVLEGSTHRMRPMMMTALTAIFGLLPAALSTRIGAQSQRPLAIAVIGGMLAALALNQYLTPVLYSLFRRAEPSRESVSLAD